MSWPPWYNRTGTLFLFSRTGALKAKPLRAIIALIEPSYRQRPHMSDNAAPWENPPSMMQFVCWLSSDIIERILEMLGSIESSGFGSPRLVYQAVDRVLSRHGIGIHGAVGKTTLQLGIIGKLAKSSQNNSDVSPKP